MSYLRAVLKNDTALEEKYLNQIIKTGKKINENTYKYQQELKKLKKRKKTTSIKKIEPLKIKPIKKTIVKKPIIKKTPKKYIKKSNNSLYTIKNIYTKKTSIIIEFYKSVSKNQIKYRITKDKYQFNHNFNISGNFKDAMPTKLKIDNIKRIYLTQKNKKLLNIKAVNNTKLKAIYFINKNKIVIKFSNNNANRNLKKKKSTPVKILTPPSYIQTKVRTVVIDAGHGGKDAGAVGPYKRYEKISVLAITKYLHANLKKRGYKVYITRKSDRYIKVRNRTVLANKKNADIFLSIHANSVPKSKAKRIHGIETFFLSPARSERAKRVAAKENKMDIRKMSNSTQNSFLTVLNQSKITASNKLAIDVQQNMLYNLKKKYKDVVDGGVREGPFWVLVGAQMPSILVEVGYISHPKESKRLYNSTYQKRLAQGIANGIDSYFLKNP